MEKLGIRRALRNTMRKIGGWKYKRRGMAGHGWIGVLERQKKMEKFSKRADYKDGLAYVCI